MVSNLRKRLAFVLVLMVIVTGMPSIAYGQTVDEAIDTSDPFEMMVDTTPELMSVDEIIEAATPQEVSQAAIDATGIDLQPSDYDDVEDVQQIIGAAVEDASSEGVNVEIDPLLLDNILEQQQDLVEQSKTDRFIVKYKGDGEDSFKEKVGDTIKESAEIEGINPESSTQNVDNNVYDIQVDTIDSVKWIEDKTEIIILEDSVNPSEFAETLKDCDVTDDIEYIQPDFKMELSALKNTSKVTADGEISLEVQPDDQGTVDETTDEQIDDNGDSSTDENSVDNTSEEPEATPTEDAVSEEPAEEPVIEETVTNEAITTDEAIAEELLEESQNKVIVGVIDTGLDITHPDLKDFIYVNTNEIAGNGIDDDGNGYIDDINGWNFPDNSGVVYDDSLGLEQAHATHIAGIIAGLSNVDDNLKPNDNISILPLKVFKSGMAYTSDIIAAIDYAENMGVKVINCSFGSTDNNQALKEAMENSNMLFVCSVGNARTDLEVTPIYPACFDLNNIISVTSTNADGGLSYFSNYSQNLVDVAALGRDINSTLPGGEYGLQSGTSMSTALVSGVAAVVLSSDNTLDTETLKGRLINTANKLSNLQKTVREGRRIDAYNAIMDEIHDEVMQNSPEDDFDVKGYMPTQSELYQLYSSSAVLKVTAGSYFSVVLKNDGTVWGWGANEYRQLGNGTNTRTKSLTQVIGIGNIEKIDAGNNHSMALKNDGTVWAWGENFCGQLGDGTTTARATPVQVSGLTDVVSISAGDFYSLAVKSDGTVWAWGLNYAGQLGDGTTTIRTTPVQVSGLTDVVSIVAGSYHSLAVKSDGTVWAWGYNYSGQLGDGTTTTRVTPVQVSGLTDVASISAGSSHSFAMKSDGTAWAWGINVYGQLGDGTTTVRKTPVQVSGLTDVVSISAGNYHSVALKSDGTVWAWGINYYGELGDGTTTDRTTPVQVSGLTDVVSISAGNNHSLAVKSDGTVWALGANDYGQLGDGTTTTRATPVQVSGLTDVVSISAGYFHSVALKSDGTVWALGANDYGQLGDGKMTARTTPVQVSGLTDVVSISAGDYYNLAIKSDGTVWAWGDNSYGQLGDGTTTIRTTPVQVSGLTDVVSISAGHYHSVAMKSDGTVWAWGYNYYGQLGDGTTTNRTTPVQVSGLTSVVSISAGYYHNLAVKSDGTVWAWGQNIYGQLGDGTKTNRTTPVQVSGLTSVVSISAGYYYNLAVKSDGTVWAWGDNCYGQLGDGTMTNRTTPMQVSGLTSVVSISAGDYYNLAVKSDGTVWAWGNNSYGQLGDGTTTRRTTPVQVSGLTDVVSISAGHNHSLALKTDGLVWSSGDDNVPIQCQTYIGTLSYSSANYTAAIPASGWKTITASAIGTDSYGRTINASSIYYILAGTYPGVSINSSTGAITIDSSAQPGSVQIMATYQNQTCSATLILSAAQSVSLNLSTTADRAYYIPLTVSKILSFTGKTFNITYDSSALEPIDLCTFTDRKETTAGVITGTGITITSISPGSIVMTIDRTIPPGKQRSGVIDIFKFKAKVTGQTSITAECN